MTDINNVKLIQQADGCILAGGKSSRMGTPKGNLKIEEKTFAECIMNEMGCFEKITLSANTDDYDYLNLEKKEDYIKDKGPVGGIYTVLKDSEKEYTFFVSCDMPFFRSGIIEILAQKLVSSPDAVIAKQGGEIYPVLGFYSKKSTSILKEHIDNNKLKMMEILLELNTIYVDIPKEYKMNNINTIQDYESIIR